MAAYCRYRFKVEFADVVRTSPGRGPNKFLLLPFGVSSYRVI